MKYSKNSYKTQKNLKIIPHKNMIIQNLLIILKNHSWNHKQIKISIFKIVSKAVFKIYQD